MAYTPEFDLRDDFSRNYIINGDMRIAQRGTNVAAVANNAYALDRWRYQKSGSAVHTITQDSDVPTFAQAGYLFQNSHRLVLTTASSSLGSSDRYALAQHVEGFNFASLAQKPMTLSFWVKATTPGIYYCYLRNSGLDRSVVEKYTINTAATWERKVLTFSSSPSAGTWNYTTGTGLEVGFTLACGSGSRTSTEDVWVSSSVIAGNSQVNGVASGSTDFRITGVMLNEGPDALPFRLAGGNYPRELFLCQRYYEKSYDLTTTPGTVTTIGVHSVSSANIIGNLHTILPFKATKRISPTIVIYDTVGNSGRLSVLTSSGTVSANSANLIAGGTYGGQHTSGFLVSPQSAGTSAMFHWTADAEL